MKKRTASIRARHFLRSQDGVSAIEFAILSPLLLLILAAVIDLGTLVYTRMQIESAVSAATAYAFANAENVSQANAGTLGNGMAKMLTARLGADITAVVEINNGSRHTYGSGQIVHSGSASYADQCYCLTSSGSALTWAANTCGITCSGGGTAGRFVTISVRKPYQPLFFDYGMTQDGKAVGGAVAKVQ